MKQGKVRNILINEIGISPDKISWTGDGYVFFKINDKEYSFNYLDESRMIKKMVDLMTGKSEYNDELQIIAFVDREDLGVSIDSVHLNSISPEDLTDDTIEYIMDNIDSLEIEGLENMDDTSKKATAINQFLKDGEIWANNYNSLLTTLHYKIEAIKK